MREKCCDVRKKLKKLDPTRTFGLEADELKEEKDDDESVPSNLNNSGDTLILSDNDFDHEIDFDLEHSNLIKHKRNVIRQVQLSRCIRKK